MTASRYTRAREMAGLSIGQAVKQLNQFHSLVQWSPAILTDIETGEHAPGVSVRAMLADLYGVSPAWLRGADPFIPRGAKQLLRNWNGTTDERDQLEELLGAIYTPESRR